MNELSNQLTNKEIKAVEGKLNLESQALATIMEDILEFPKATPLKTIEQQLKTRAQHSNQFIKHAHDDAQKSVELFFNEALPAEIEELKRIFEKLSLTLLKELDNQGLTKLSLKECQFLEDMAKRKMINQKTMNASQMYRFIVQINEFFSEAWVGWALCEQELQNNDVVDFIYQIALELLPYDYYLILFAADYYLLTKQKEKASNLLKKAKKQLVDDQAQDSHAYLAIVELMQTI